jgi:hypothetical protein
VKIKKVIEERIRRQSGKARVAGDVNAVISANVNEPGRSVTSVSNKQRVVQRTPKKPTEGR